MAELFRKKWLTAVRSYNIIYHCGEFYMSSQSPDETFKIQETNRFEAS